MARTIRDSKLESRAARTRLPLGPKTHWKTLEPGQLHLGYRRKVKDQPGLWLARRYKGAERYQVVPLALADDFTEGAGVLSYAEAQRAAHTVRWTTAPRRRRTTHLTVADAIQDYIAWLEGNRATARDAELRANALILPHLGKTIVAELTTQAITDWLNQIASAGALTRGNPRPHPVTKDEKRARRATANRTLTTLKAALNRAFRAGQVDDDTAWRRVKAFDKVNAQRPGFLTLIECKRLINAAQGDFRTLVHAALLSGARYGELRALQVRDFVHGKLHIRESKSGQPRHITLADEAVRFFAQLTVGRAGSEPLLTRNGNPWQKSEQARPMREACERAKIVPPIGFHQLRHTYCSLSIMADMPLPVLAQNVGHSSTRMLELHYKHLRESYVDQVIKAAAPKFGLVHRGNVRVLE